MSEVEAKPLGEGDRFGFWAVIKRDTKRNGKWHYICRCGKCEGLVSVLKRSLLLSKSTQCAACAQKERTKYKREIQSGEMFGSWKVLRIHSKDDTSRVKYVCLCTKCNREFIISWSSLTYKKSEACRGCQNKEKICDNNKIPPGTKFGFWEALYFDNSQKGNRYICKCHRCQSEHSIPATYLRNNRTKQCETCYKRKKGKLSSKWTGYQDLSGSMFGRYKAGAKWRQIEFNITIEYAWGLFVKQNARCAISGVQLHIKPSENNEVTASLDRIDSAAGYIVGNLQWIHKKLNAMKSDYSTEEFISWCHLVAESNPRPSQKLATEPTTAA